jgi:HEAT repeat protein
VSDNGRNGFDATPEGRVAYLETMLEPLEPWIDHTPIFIEYLSDEDPQVRATAIRGLWYSDDLSLIDRLIEMAEEDPSEMVRARAISALGIYIHEGEVAEYDADFGPMTELIREDDLPEADFVRVKEFLLAAYADEDRSVDERRFAIEALGFLSDPEITDLVQEAYDRPEKDWKISALFAMGRSGLTRWSEILGRELYNADPDIQREAIRAVGAVGMDELGKDLWRLTYSDDQDVMLEAIDALGQTGWEGAFDRLEELTLDPDPDIAQAAEAALDEWLMMRELLGEDEDLDSDLDLGWDQGD